jgi:hypothetical protein
MNLRDFFYHPHPVTVAERELAEAQRCLLLAQTGLEYAQAMVGYHDARVKRLRAYVAREKAQDSTA